MFKKTKKKRHISCGCLRVITLLQLPGQQTTHINSRRSKRRADQSEDVPNSLTSFVKEHGTTESHCLIAMHTTLIFGYLEGTLPREQAHTHWEENPENTSNAHMNCCSTLKRGHIFWFDLSVPLQTGVDRLTSGFAVRISASVV